MLVITIENPLATAVGVLGNILSICGVLAPVPTFFRIYKKKSTESFHSIPYVTALFSGMLWLYYALLTMDVWVMTVNVFSCTLQSSYILIYLIYAPKKPKALTLKLISLLNVGVFGSIVLLSFIFLKGKKRLDVIGFLSAALAVTVFAAPLSVIKLVIRTKSVEYMPFLLSFSYTLSAIIWFCYGLLIRDYFIAAPNTLGFTFGIAQIILYFMYMNGKRTGSKPELLEQAKHALPTTTESETELVDNTQSAPELVAEESDCAKSESLEHAV